MEEQDFVAVYMPFGMSLCAYDVHTICLIMFHPGFMNDMQGVNPANQLMDGDVPNALGKILLNGEF